MRWRDIPFRPTQRMLRQFAGLWILFFGFLASSQALIGQQLTAMALAVLAIAIGGLGLFRPQAVRPIFVGWSILAWPVGWVLSRALLALLYYGLFTPVGILFKAIRRDPLRRRRQTARRSYWVLKPAPANARSYLHQF